jgi:hypothetical protein
MIKEKLSVFVLIFPFFFITSCEQRETHIESEAEPSAEIQTAKSVSIHNYGGWYCPDNLNGFPPVSVSEYASVPSINGRMSTQEETRNGSSLMYFDPAEYPTAKPLDMIMPRLANYYSNITKQNELVIVIQAVAIDKDTVVGFRYLNGGNGTSWFNEVSFLSPDEIDELGSTPFVFLEAEISASKEKVWAIIAKTEYAKSLGKRFGQEEFFKSEWSPNSRVKLNFEGVQEKANGSIMTLFGNIYLQINSDFDGRQSVEKILIMDNEEGSDASIQIVFGPISEDFETQKKNWEEWLQKVKTDSEKD